MFWFESLFLTLKTKASLRSTILIVKHKEEEFIHFLKISYIG